MVAQLLNRATLDRALQPMRRRRIARALRAMPAPQSILVLCHGNLCRSPFAAAILARELGPCGVAVTSAGIAPSQASSPGDAIAAAQRRNVDMTAHVAPRATHAMVAQADLIVV